LIKLGEHMLYLCFHVLTLKVS